MSHTSLTSEESSMKCGCPEMNPLPFLDVLCSIKQNKIVTDLYRKETDRNQYLLTSSCHPVETRERRFLELKELLQEREYKTGMINSAIEKARKIPRFKDLKEMVQNLSERRPVFVVTYDPRLPIYLLFKESIGEPWLVYMSEVFPEPPLTAFKNQRTSKNI